MLLLVVFLLRIRPSIKYVHSWWNEGDRDHPKYGQVPTGAEGYHVSCVRMHLHSLFSLFILIVSCFI